MTNNEIVLWIEDNIDIMKFIKRVIKDSYNENNQEDLKQYILLYLLEYNNDKLNNLYKLNNLKPFIMQIILNQRNYYKSYYNNYLRIIAGNEIYDQVYQDETENLIEKNNKIEFAQKELKKYIGKRRNLTKEQQYEMLIFEIYRMYLKRGYSIQQMADRLDLGYNTVYRLLKKAKEKIKENYDRNNNDTDYNIYG